MRAAALEALYYSDPANADELLVGALRDPDPRVVAKGLGLVATNESRIRAGGNTAASEFPTREFLDLVLRAGEIPSSSTDDVRRILLNQLSAVSADQVLLRLLEILIDPDRKDEYVLVIRAIGGIARSGRATTLDSGKSALEKMSTAIAGLASAAAFRRRAGSLPT
jgi:hypothetical protein